MRQKQINLQGQAPVEWAGTDLSRLAGVDKLCAYRGAQH
jgi:hypothetical protein